MEDSKKYWVGFNLVKGIGSARLKALLDFFGDIERAWNAPADALRSTGLGSKQVNAVLEVRASDQLDKTWEFIQKRGITVINWEDGDYPRYLKEIYLPPPVLYMRGNLLEEDDWSVAVVGTRRITQYGRQVANEIAGMLAQNGVTVVSGLARGVDSAAHQAALDNGGRTLAVFGSGIDRIYPPENRKLVEHIVSHGAVLSDYPPGTAPEAANFPARNRIISGLARAVVVVEAGKRSGALITAAFAADQGRDVFAVPGNIYAPQSIGANLLIQQGASPLLDPQDVLESLNLAMLGEHRAARTVLPADANEAKLYSILGREPLHVDEIHAQADLPIEKVSATLTLMELKGIIRQVGTMHYVAVHEPEAEYKTVEDG
ncbi:MAG TPA: DNA-processing protein DprA [Anaerolineales bacterium]|nr:DNA-processing protein DprA [Anaerolineales bacterium]